MTQAIVCATKACMYSSMDHLLKVSQQATIVNQMNPVLIEWRPSLTSSGDVEGALIHKNRTDNKLGLFPTPHRCCAHTSYSHAYRQTETFLQNWCETLLSSS